MSDYQFKRRSMDEAIDDAVRDMIRRDPRPGLRRRILAKIGAPERQSASAGWLIAPAGVLTCIVLAFVLFNRGAPGVPVTTATPSVAADRAPVVSLPPARGAHQIVGQEPRRSRGNHRRTAANRTLVTPTSIFGARTDRASAASLAPAVDIDDGPPVDAVMPLPGFMLESAPSALVLPALEIQPLHLPALAPRR